MRVWAVVDEIRERGGLLHMEENQMWEAYFRHASEGWVPYDERGECYKAFSPEDAIMGAAEMFWAKHGR